MFLKLTFLLFTLFVFTAFSFAKDNDTITAQHKPPVREEEVIVTSQKTNRVNQSLMGVEKLNMKIVNKLPVVFGERDIIKMLTLLPGVKTGTSGLSVRGGSVDQNLILLDKAVIYNSDHLLGFFSTFNSDAVKDVTLYKGPAPAQYGGRLASVIDVQTKNGNNEKFHVKGGLGLISSRLSIEGQIQKGKSSFFISGRRTYADLFLKLSKEFKNNVLYFYDLNGKFNYKFSDKNEFFISAYYGLDKLGLNDALKTNNFGIKWRNIALSARFKHIFHQKLFSNTSFTYSNYNYKINIENPTLQIDILSHIRDLSIRHETEYMPNNQNHWHIGIHLTWHKNNPGQITGHNIQSIKNLRNGIETAIYAANEWKLNNKIKINYGLRLTDYLVLGGSNYYTFDTNKEITDTINRPGIIKHYFNIEPRISVNYKLLPEATFKFSYTRNTQHVHLLSNSIATSPTDRWIMNSNIVRPEISDQLSVGYTQNFWHGIIELSIEAYYKWMKNQVDYADSANDKDLFIERQLRFGRGRAYGIEFLLKKIYGKFTGWIAYTFSITERKIQGVNDNLWYFARQNRPQDVTIVLLYELSKRWNISGLWTFKSGYSVTFPTGKYEIAGQTVWQYSHRNANKMPDIHRLDLSLNYITKATKKFKSEISISIYNVYARENASLIRFEQSKSNPNKTIAIQIALGKIIPSLTWNFTLF